MKVKLLKRFRKRANKQVHIVSFGGSCKVVFAKNRARHFTYIAQALPFWKEKQRLFILKQNAIYRGRLTTPSLLR